MQLAVFTAGQGADPVHGFVGAGDHLALRRRFSSAVRVTPRGLRLNKSTPISSSRLCNCRLKAGWATRRRSAALVKFEASATATK